MRERIVMLGAGTVGGLCGRTFCAHSHDVTLIETYLKNFLGVRTVDDGMASA